ncbi:unnamed protein product, partial [Cuscuta campestris]
MRVFRWSADFDPSVESPLVPVWVGLEGLPIHLFEKPTLFSIAKLFGSRLQTDAATVNLSRPNVARVCVEVNLSKELPKAIWIHLGTKNSRWVRKTKPRGKVVTPGQPVYFPSNAAVPTSTTPITFGSLETGHQYVTTKDIGPCPTMSKNAPPPRLDSTALAPPTDANFVTLDSISLSLPTDANLDASYLECAQHKDTKDNPLLTGPCGLELTIEGPSCPVEQDLSSRILPQSQNDGYDPNHTDENMRAHETHRESSDGTPSDTTVPPIGNDDALSDPSTHTKVHAGKDDEAGKDALTEAEPVSPHTLEDNTNISCLGEGQSTTRPPLFDGTNYTYWKERMRIYIQSTNFLLWRIIKNGENVPMKKVEETNVPKTEDEYDAQDIKKVENNAKAINIIYCVVNPDDYRKISCCTTAKEMWDKLEITYEGEQKKKGIALKATSSQEPAMEESSDEDNEIALVIKKFHKFMRKEYERKGKKHGGPPKCYGCGEVGHIKPKCPNPKNEKEKKPFKKHRAYISWGGDSGDESSEGKENESANLCLMAHEEPPEEAYRVFNKRTLTVEESPHVVFAENDARLARKVSFDDLIDSLENIYDDEKVDNSKESQDEEVEPPVNEEQPQEEETPMPRAWRTSKNHPLDK